ncbi:MAG: hypothetical protein JWN14_2741, partial [Chthonomonadales bacterium]|nr:hypothetical protein [Chthonomonadales bacterium]
MAKQRGRYPHISDEQLVLNALL